LLAGRKLLLADDSVTIQKVIDLTFADEGVRVVAVSNGQDAIDQLEEVAPDIVLADVFMPSRNGYEVCEYVKKNEKLKHIPVMLLVGSFEPFDEAEARRVGADDILTKPFQSIRRLIDRVGALVTRPPVQKEVPTAELPRPEKPAEDVGLDAEELEISTADTRPLGQDLVEQSVIAKKSRPREEKMDTGVAEPMDDSQSESSEGLLDLGEFEPVYASSAEDFVLDLDVEESSAVTASEAAPVRAFVEPEPTQTSVSGGAYEFSYEPETRSSSFEDTQEVPYEDRVHEVAVDEPELSYDQHQAYAETERTSRGRVAPSGLITLDQLSPEAIDAIARRAVEMLSEKVVQEIAWEVVPDLAELMIKRQLEQKESQPK
jgi:CheY-like chemotaxis protein